MLFNDGRSASYPVLTQNSISLTNKVCALAHNNYVYVACRFYVYTCPKCIPRASRYAVRILCVYNFYTHVKIPYSTRSCQYIVVQTHTIKHTDSACSTHVHTHRPSNATHTALTNENMIAMYTGKKGKHYKYMAHDIFKIFQKKQVFSRSSQ